MNASRFVVMTAAVLYCAAPNQSQAQDGYAQLSTNV